MSEQIDVPNSVIVTGLTHTEIDEEVGNHLKQYGSINRILTIDNQRSEFHLCSIVEYAYNTAMHTLRPSLPLVFESSADANIIFSVRSLDSVYTSTASSNATKGYLEELQAIANKSGRSFELVLQEELMKMQRGKDVSIPAISRESKNIEVPSMQQPSLLLGPVSPELVKTLPTVLPPSPSIHHGQVGSRAFTQASPTHAVSLPRQTTMRRPQSLPSTITINNPSPSAMLTTALSSQLPVNLNHRQGPLLNKDRGDCETAAVMPPAITVNDVNPPAVQRMVVEHVVRTNEALAPMPSSFRLRPFSGKIPRPNSELDYETWRANVDLILTDPSMSDLHRTRKILDSLLPPATDVIRHVNPHALPSVYLQLLDSVYGSVEDGDELLAKFMVTLQDRNEKPSHYLNRLQIALSAVVRRGGISETERDRYLLKQFCRGCWNNVLISDLQLERKTAVPLTFTDLVLLIRTEEDKQASKQNRMTQHLGLYKQSPATPKMRATTQQLTACNFPTIETEITEAESLRRQIDQMQAQIAVMQTTTPCKAKSKHSEDTEMNILKRQIADVKAQIADMRVVQEAHYDHLESAEVKAMRHELAILHAQAQVKPPQNLNHQAPLSMHARDFSMTARQPSGRAGTRHPNSELTARGRPRPWYCFRCGEDAHLASNCMSEPNPPLVEEKRRLLKEKQERWDQQNEITGNRQLNF